MNVANLQPRAFALARWKLREWLFAFGDEKPEQFDPWRERVLILYAYCTWIYRFTLFLGIALIVYHKFFKILGIALFMVEISTFIVVPVIKEMKEWTTLLRTARFNRRTSGSAAAGFVLLCVLFVPWNNNVTAPALLQSERQVRLLSPIAAQVVEIHAAYGQTVGEGEPLFRLRSPELHQEIAMLRRRIVALQWELSFHFIRRETAAEVPVALRERQAARKRLAMLKAQEKQLVIRAPLGGVVVDMPRSLAQGEWIGAGEWLCTAADTMRPQAVAYVDGRELYRLRKGSRAKFIAEDSGQPDMELEIVSIASTASRHLSAAPELASPNGGAIAAVRAPRAVATSLGGDTGGWVPEQAVYRVVLRPVHELEMPPRVLRGSVVVAAERESLFMRCGRYVLAVFLRETGF